MGTGFLSVTQRRYIPSNVRHATHSFVCLCWRTVGDLQFVDIEVSNTSIMLIWKGTMVHQQPWLPFYLPGIGQALWLNEIHFFVFL